TEDMDKMAFHKIVRGSSRRAQIVYEYTDGNTEEDMIEDPLPFDMDAPVIEVKDEDFALWYRDITEEPKKWIGKTVRMKGVVVTNRKFEPGVFAFGRQIMTCCVQDIQYCSLVSIGKKDLSLETQSWYEAELKIDFKFHKLYMRKGPILNVVSIQRCAAPEQEVATFF
ncbi:MAG: GTPase, partial [Firmicutes bacterium]|nr:GTPase [Bacillota bacterium]